MLISRDNSFYIPTLFRPAGEFPQIPYGMYELYLWDLAGNRVNEYKYAFRLPSLLLVADSKNNFNPTYGRIRHALEVFFNCSGGKDYRIFYYSKRQPSLRKTGLNVRSLDHCTYLFKYLGRIPRYYDKYIRSEL